MAADFTNALIEFWAADPSLSSLGVGTLYPESAPNATYPYAVLSQTGSKTGGRTFARSSWRDTFYRVGVYDSSRTRAIAIGNVVATVMETLIESPLTFGDGEQVFCLESSDDLIKLKNPGTPTGTTANPYIWCRSLLFQVRIARTRV